uniref:Uncharacterized protein n=1 Tax=Rhizophora mucronata TaxID=61149 RepID=A0A2P2R4U1_RHIMU
MKKLGNLSFFSNWRRVMLRKACSCCTSNV